MKQASDEARAGLEAFAEDLKRREAELDKRRDELRAERDEAIRAAHKGDLTMKTIAQILDMSWQRVQQIVRS